MSLATSGHNANIAFESGAVTNGVIAAPVMGTFTVVPELRGDLLGFNGSRDFTDATPHGEDIDSGVTGPIKRSESKFTLNYDPTNAVHTAMRAAFLATTVALRRRGWRFWGPNGAANVDEVIQSGEIVGWQDKAPEGAGIRQVDVTVRFSKQAKVDGVLYGTSA
jgi:hypothetical protein